MEQEVWEAEECGDMEDWALEDLEDSETFIDHSCCARGARGARGANTIKPSMLSAGNLAPKIGYGLFTKYNLSEGKTSPFDPRDGVQDANFTSLQDLLYGLAPRFQGIVRQEVYLSL